MVCPISQSPELRLRRRPESENVYGDVFSVTYGARSYNPRLGRWINRDPIGEAGDKQLYLFSGNASVFFIDVLGKSKLGDLYDAITDPKELIIGKAKDVLEKNPYLKVAIASYELSKSIAESFEKELRFDNLLKDLDLSLSDLRKIDKCLTDNFIGSGGFLGFVSAKAVDQCLCIEGYTNKVGYTTQKALSHFPGALKKGIINFGKDQVMGILTKKTVEKHFPDADKLPSDVKKTVDNIGGFVADRLKDIIKEKTDL